MSQKCICFYILLFLGTSLFSQNRDGFIIPPPTEEEKRSGAVVDLEISGYEDGAPKTIIIPREPGESERKQDVITKIGEEAFFNKGIIRVTFHDEIREIGDRAFAQNGLDALELPSTVSDVGEKAFADNKLTELKLSEKRSGSQTFGESAFANNSLKVVKIPASVVLGKNSFRNNKLESVTLESSPNRKITIPEGAFADNKALTEITIGNNVTIDPEAFDTNFADFYNAQDKKAGTFEYDIDQWYTSEAAKVRREKREWLAAINRNPGGFIFSEQAAAGEALGNLDIIGFTGSAVRITIPGAPPVETPKDILPSSNGADQVRVTGIGKEAFVNKKLVELTLPDSITTIGSRAFAGNKTIEKITIGSNVTIEAGAFDTDFAAFYNDECKKQGGVFEYDDGVWCTQETARERRAYRAKLAGLRAELDQELRRKAELENRIASEKARSVRLEADLKAKNADIKSLQNKITDLQQSDDDDDYYDSDAGFGFSLGYYFGMLGISGFSIGMDIQLGPKFDFGDMSLAVLGEAAFEVGETGPVVGHLGGIIEYFFPEQFFGIGVGYGIVSNFGFIDDYSIALGVSDITIPYFRAALLVQLDNMKLSCFVDFHDDSTLEEWVLPAIGFGMQWSFW